jgi:hypothetical protein
MTDPHSDGESIFWYSYHSKNFAYKPVIKMTRTKINLRHLRKLLPGIQQFESVKTDTKSKAILEIFARMRRSKQRNRCQNPKIS